MTYEVLHRRTAYGWEFHCPLLTGVEGGASTFQACCAAAEHAVRTHLSAGLRAGLSPEVVRELVHHHRQEGRDTLYSYSVSNRARSSAPMGRANR